MISSLLWEQQKGDWKPQSHPAESKVRNIMVCFDPAEMWLTSNVLHVWNGSHYRSRLLQCYDMCCKQD